MKTFTQPTGNAGTMRVDDDEANYIDFYLLGVGEAVTVPWGYAINGAIVSWRVARLLPNTEWQKLGTAYVGVSQTIKFEIAATGNVKVGGPTEFDVAIERPYAVVPGAASGTTLIRKGNVLHRAIPYVNDNGVWKQAGSWAKALGEWKPAS